MSKKLAFGQIWNCYSLFWNDLLLRWYKWIHKDQILLKLFYFETLGRFMANKFSKWNWLFNMKYLKSENFFESFSEADGTPFQKWIASFQQSSRVVRRHQLTINKLTWTAPNTKKAPVLSVEKELSLWQNLIKKCPK